MRITATKGSVWVHLQGGLSTLLSHTTHLHKGVKVRHLLGGDPLMAAFKTDNNRIVCRVLIHLRVLKLSESQSIERAVPLFCASEIVVSCRWGSCIARLMSTALLWPSCLVRSFLPPPSKERSGRPDS
jgi:hypothetical protein